MERWLLVVSVAAMMAALLLLAANMRGRDLGALIGGMKPATVAAPAFDVENELAALLRVEPSEPVDLAAGAVVEVRDTFLAASGPPLDLLAQIGAAPLPRVQLAVAAPLPGPVLTGEEQLIVDANAERREVRLALQSLNARAAVIDLGVAIAVQPLLLRAQLATERLDAFGDALLLSSSPAERQATYFAFQANRAAALGDIERASHLLG